MQERTAVTAATGRIAADTRSATSWKRDLDDCACLTSPATRASEFWCTSCETWTSSDPLRFSVPAMTAEPGDLGEGSDSPVANDWSTSLEPATTSPSVGILESGRMRTMSP